MLQIEPADLPWLQRPGANARDLLALRFLRSGGHQPSEEFFTWLEANRLKEAEHLRRALCYTTPHKLMRYLDQRFAELAEGDYRGRKDVLSDYNDYLGFCEQLHDDLSNDFVLFPQNLTRAHDQANDRIEQYRVEQYNPQIAGMQKELKRLYQFKSDGLMVRPPRSAQEIVIEGQKLHHCVGGYAQSMAKQECVILFIRQEARKDKPFYTVEVQGRYIQQVRGANNRAPVPEVKAFLDKWKKKRHLEDAA